MPIPQNAVNAVQAVQRNVAEDPSRTVRLIAGPGTGKSSCIEQRVCWLLSQGIPAGRIFVVSFTRASSRDLRARIQRYCDTQSQPAGANVQVSTLHSFALRTLRRAGLLARYPADPLVLDDWELANIFDPEFSASSGIRSKRRRAQIRYYHEAHWSTGVFSPTNYLPPNPPISQRESTLFLNFHGPTSQSYSCVLPGEIVRQCVQEINAGTIDPVELLRIEHLIVDEFQDLNPMDLELSDGLVVGANVFIAGDDDQSIYSFRFANPSGIQTFPSRHPATVSHALDECFRCMPEILRASSGLMVRFALPNRISKNITSLYRHCAHRSNGCVHRWRFANGATEARAIAQSVAGLVNAGISPSDILILLNHQPALSPLITDELDRLHMPFDVGEQDTLANSAPGRLGLAILRIVGDTNDYIAHRTVLGIRLGVGVNTTNQIRAATIQHNLNYRSLFYDPLPAGIFRARSVTALNNARAVCGQIAQWSDGDVFSSRTTDLYNIIAAALGVQDATIWQNFASTLPQGITLKELREVLWAANEEQRLNLLVSVYERLDQAIPATNTIPPRVRIMTMHGAKGLSAPIVFIPGLEDQLLPGPKRLPYAGLVLEAARLLYVSITRARVCCVLTYAGRRFINGQTQLHAPSRFNAALGGAFAQRHQGLNSLEIQQIVTEHGSM